MASINAGALRAQAPDWMLEVRATADREIESMQRALTATLNALSSELARRATTEDIASIDEIDQVALAFLGTVRRLLSQLADRLSEGLADQLQSLQEVVTSGDVEMSRLVSQELGRWDRSIRNHESMVGQYAAGWIEGGGVALSLMMGLQAEDLQDATVYRSILRDRLSFVGLRTDAAVSQWIDEVQRGIESVVTQIEGHVALANTRGADSLVLPNAEPSRLDRLLSQAQELGVRIRNVPEVPSERYLAKLQLQLDEIARKQAQQHAARQARAARLQDLLKFADSLGVKPKGVPENPSDAWLDRLESKLSELADRKGLSLPRGIEPPTQMEMRPTNQPPPPRRPPEHLALRVQGLVDRAQAVGLELGRIPEEPTEAWVADMEGRLESAMEERRQRRRQLRMRRDVETQQRLEQLQRQADELGVDLGRVPEPPSEEWLTAAELEMASARLEAEQRRSQRAGTGDEKRLRMVRNAAAAVGVDLGMIPPHPDDVWLSWAESRVREAADLHKAESIAVETDSADSPRAYLVYEEGTVQEQVWVIGEEEVTVGRSRGNDVQIRDDPSVSRRHATVRMVDGAFLIQDLGSTKGTLVDDALIEQTLALRGGERIQFGETSFVFRVR